MQASLCVPQSVAARPEVSPVADDQGRFPTLPVMMVKTYGGAEVLTTISTCYRNSDGY